MNRFRFLLLSACLWQSLAVAAGPSVVGWLERAKVATEGLVISAKLDTGADTSSLDAHDIRWFSRGGNEWVAFGVVDSRGGMVRFERKVVRIARIRRIEGDSQERPTIMMGICVGNVYRVTEVNLADRTGFDHSLLVGRSFLAKHFIVDPARTYTTEPTCDRARTQ